ncbi:hypothetical protein B0T20DRAFT_502030 [Sordaria brevicollis]|uniref:Uncharacterized protein n=1 Tax=Sordaria brevicollis TaxID=83679 RepID=A0AAE0UA94_SORBR|nr:hypothetical protein B0T20DRAFT_502030 [Sordaria brevicollis]
MTIPKRPPSPSLTTESLGVHHDKRPKVDEEPSSEGVASKIQQQDKVVNNASEGVSNTVSSFDKVIKSTEDAYPTSSDADSDDDDDDDDDDGVASSTARVAPRVPGTGRSPSPSGDLRTTLWRKETRAFNGKITIRKRNKRDSMERAARQAQGEAPLIVKGKPIFNMFVDGSYQRYVKHTLPDLDSHFARGGYGVVFRNPYHGKGSKEFDHGQQGHEEEQMWDNRGTGINTPEDGLGKSDFNIRSWRSHRVYGAWHAEMAAISQALETVITLVKRHKPSSGVSVTIFSDCKDVIKRIQRPPARLSEEMTDKDALSMPLLRAIVWQSHYLVEEWDCEIELRWLPRCCVLAHRLADHVARWWKNKDKDESGDGTGITFQQKDRPVWHRDGMLDVLHKDFKRILKKVKNGEIRHPAGRIPARKLKEKERGNMLDRFTGSAVQEEMSTDALLMMPPIWERSAAFRMVNEDMDKILGLDPAVRKRMSTNSLRKMPPVWERSAAFRMVNEDMNKVLGLGSSKQR